MRARQILMRVPAVRAPHLIVGYLVGKTGAYKDFRLAKKNTSVNVKTRSVVKVKEEPTSPNTTIYTEKGFAHTNQERKLREQLEAEKVQKELDAKKKAADEAAPSSCDHNTKKKRPCNCCDASPMCTDCYNVHFDSMHQTRCT